MNHDFEYYIKAAKEKADRSYNLWQCVNRYIYSVLVRCQKEEKTLMDAAAILDKSAGKKKRDEPTAMMNFRIAARQIRAGEDLLLL